MSCVPCTHFMHNYNFKFNLKLRSCDLCPSKNILSRKSQKLQVFSFTTLNGWTIKVGRQFQSISRHYHIINCLLLVLCIWIKSITWPIHQPKFICKYLFRKCILAQSWHFKMFASLRGGYHGNSFTGILLSFQNYSTHFCKYDWLNSRLLKDLSAG